MRRPRHRPEPAVAAVDQGIERVSAEFAEFAGDVGATPLGARPAESARRPPGPEPVRKQSKRVELEERYIRLEGELSGYRHP